MAQFGFEGKDRVDHVTWGAVQLGPSQALILFLGLGIPYSSLKPKRLPCVFLGLNGVVQRMIPKNDHKMHD